MKKAHWIANKFRDERTHRNPFYIATALWKGAQLPSTHTRYGTTAPFAPGDRCPVALLTIATLFGNGKPEKGIKDAVAAIHAHNAEAGANKIKGKIG